MGVKINSRSELIHSELTRIKEVQFWTRTEPPNIPPDRTDRTYTVMEHDRLDNLAQTFYGTPHARWVIKLANDIWLEPNELVPGMTLRLPSNVRLKQLGVVLR